MDEYQLLYEYFPELVRDGLRVTHRKQWYRFLDAFSELCLWVHCSRSAHRSKNGIVLFPTWWNKHLPNHHRWHFNVEVELSPYLVTSGHYDYKKGLSKEWVPSENFLKRSASLITDKRFKTSNHWKGVIKSVINNTLESTIEISQIKIDKLPDIKPDLNIESYLIYSAYADKLKEGMPVTYTVSNTSRLHNPLQNIKKYHRNKIFNGWYSYDFKACAPSILAQEYARLVPNSSLPAIHLFIENREQIRQEIANHTGIPEITVKRALTGLFFGQTVPTQQQARWDISHTTSLEKYRFSLINAFGPLVTEKLLNNPIFIDIVQECQLKLTKELAYYLRSMCTMSDTGFYQLTNISGGIKEMARWNSRQAVAHWYFGWERKMIDIASEVMINQDANFLLVHDGWIANKQIDTTQILYNIKTQTHFTLHINEEKISQEI